MPDYDLTGLSARSFEQMIQALACKVIGPGIVIFGDGPDGGREATFEGKLSDFPTTGSEWDGYLVIQTKFRQRPLGKTGEDSDWALEQLKKEMDAFSKKGSKRKKPQYYIFATNVVLSAVQHTGGKDKLSEMIDSYKKKIGLKDYRFWEYDQICRFLDADESVRKAYGAWITPGDVLANLAAVVDRRTPDFSKVMVNFLQKEILDDHYSKLEQAGHSPENRIPLEEVFVDLPAFQDRRSEAPNEKEGENLPPGFLIEMLSVGSTCLRPEYPGVFAIKESMPHQQIKDEQGRFVLVGGPGQGKSTISQFLCQIQRANLLRHKGGLDTDVREAITSIASRCSAQRLPLAVARRFPLRIELARFAKILGLQAEAGVTSVLSYITYLVKDRTDYNVAVEDLRSWLEIYPWLVVLDGLDEVPASSNRDEVLSAIRDFLVDVSMSNGDVLVLATTRPQGYNAEFSPQRYNHRWLAPLSTTRALHYGQTLVELTYAHNVQRKKEVLNRLKDAVTTPTTARLMESPLQITIMARLLAQIAQPPQERYKLFHQYYKVIYRREMERGVEKLSKLLRDHEPNVDSIHHRTGLLLQMECERTRHTDATITIDDFKTVVMDRLQGEGYSGDDLRELADAIAACATDRLVFLVPSQSERVGFEIRSLQEFMAAEALVDGSDKLVVDRLKSIAPVPSWQNVLLFAAGKCFLERQWLRDSISQVCRELNDDPQDNLAHLTLAGSRMAVSLLEDGPARQQPAYAQALARGALWLLSLPPERIHERLSDVFEPSFETAYREELSRQMRSSDAARSFAAWVLIANLAGGKGVAWAQDMGESCWPQNKDSVVNILKVLFNLFDDSSSENKWVINQYFRVFFNVPFMFSRPHYFVKDFKPARIVSKLINHALKLLTFRLRYRMLFLKEFTFDGVGSFQIPLVTLAESRKMLSPFTDLKDVHEYWALLKEGARFAIQPSTEHLAHTLEQVTAHQIHANFGYQYMNFLPWPLSACLVSANNMKEIQILASRVRQGAMGGPDEWQKAEKRWQSEGIKEDDLTHMTDERWPISKDISDIGFPFAMLKRGWGFRGSAAEHSGDLAFSFWQRLPGENARSLFAELFLGFNLLDFLIGKKGFSEFISDMVKSLKNNYRVLTETLLLIFYNIEDPTEKANLFNHVGCIISNDCIYTDSSNQRQLLQKVALFLTSWLEQHPYNDGLVNLLSVIAASVQIDRLPNCLKEFILSKKPKTSRAAVVLQLAQRGIRPAQIQRIMQEVLEQCISDQKNIMLAISIFEQHQMDNPAGIALLENMLTTLPLSYVEARCDVMRILKELLGRRVAPLSDKRVWDKLCLPAGLFSLLST